MKTGKSRNKTYNVKMSVMYDGSRFQGWQRLGNGKENETIQGILERCISDILEEEVMVIGSGRTDAGVHAYGQVANVHITKELDLNEFQNQINQSLPKEIQVYGLEYVANQFHSRYDATSKYYEYHIGIGEVESPFYRKQRLYVREELNLDLMRKAAEYLCGTHDFTGFSSTMKDGRNTVKTIYEIEIMKEKDQIIISYHGDGFLYNMVRILTGTLLEIGQGDRTPESILTIFEKGDRQYAGKTVEGKGLFLKKVVYI
ncbi:MAG: tRNA pseudouridine(38-40) synthase TruA [bacterium]|nr:tRNA pseudouridine(38-40) synthase TruA [bacterium]